MKVYLITAIAAAAVLGFSSCSDMSSLGSAPASTMGTVANVYTGTVISARTVQVDASSTDKNLGTGIGAAAGAGAGSLLGRGKGQLVSAVGFGIVGAVAGRGIGKAAGKTTAQKLTIRIDGSNEAKTVTQPIYKEIGAIGVGVHGTLEVGSSGSVFVPDGF